MDSISYLLAANIAIWLGIGAYVLSLALGQKRLGARLKQLEIMNHDNE